MQAIDCFFPPIRFRLGIDHFDNWELSDDLVGLASLISDLSGKLHPNRTNRKTVQL